jgi:hypothetical protein
MSNPSSNEPFLNAAEAAKFLGMSQCYLREHSTRRSPRIPSYKISANRRRWKLSDLQSYAAENFTRQGEK